MFSSRTTRASSSLRRFSPASTSCSPALVIDCSGGSQNRLRFRGKGILDTHIISDVAQCRYAYLTIPAHTPHLNAAILYTLYLSSPEGQEKVVWDYYGWDLDLYPNSHAG